MKLLKHFKIDEYTTFILYKFDNRYKYKSLNNFPYAIAVRYDFPIVDGYVNNRDLSMYHTIKIDLMKTLSNQYGKETYVPRFPDKNCTFTGLRWASLFNAKVDFLIDSEEMFDTACAVYKLTV